MRPAVTERAALEQPSKHPRRRHALEPVGQLVHRLEPLGGVDGETAEDDGLQLRGQLGADVAQLGGGPAQAGDHRILRRFPGERQLAGKQLEGQNAERVDVAPSVERLAADLLGAHELRGAEHDARRGELGHLGAGAALLGEAEVHHDGLVARLAGVGGTVRHEHDVLGLEVPMDDLEVVRVLEQLQASLVATPA